MKHKYDLINEKAIIINAIKRIAKLLGKTPTQKEYKQYKESGELSLAQIFYRYSNWSNAILEAGLTPNPLKTPPRHPEISRNDLIDEYIRVANFLMKMPSNHEFRVNSKYSWTPYKTKWGNFKQAVEFILKNYKEKFLFNVDKTSDKSSKTYKPKLLAYKCNMIYEPTNEYETIALFVILSQPLGYKIKRIQSNFPDAILINDKNEEISVEFEYLSSNYIQHSHPKNFNGICICWRKDIELDNIIILSLEEYIKDIK